MSSNILPLLTQRAFNRPLLIHPSLAGSLYGLFEERLPGAVPPTLQLPGESGLILPPSTAGRMAGNRRRENGTLRLSPLVGRTAVITIDGSLVNRGAWVGADFCTGLVSYEGIKAQIEEAVSDQSVGAIALDINSYGGEANGMFTLAEAIRSARTKRPVIAVVNDIAASAGYGIAAAADAIFVSPTSVVGSIGVVMLHVDQSKSMERRGLSPTFIYAGAHKVDGHPFAPLPEGVRDEMRRDVATFYDQFVTSVAQGRGRRLTDAAARKTEARTFIGGEAIKAGLADRFGTLDDALAELNRPSRANPSSQPKGTSTMHYGEPDLAALATARTAERARIKSILTLPEAQGRQTSAMAFALDSDMAPEAAKAALTGIPIGSSVPTAPAPDQRHNGPEMGPGAPDMAGGAAQVKAGWAKAFDRG